jgi:hypothetical protein
MTRLENLCPLCGKKFHMLLGFRTLARGYEFQNEVDEEKPTRLFGEEFHTLSHVVLCIENAGGL